MDKLKIALVQSDIIWESPKENRNKINRLLDDIADVDLVILPEMFSTGFSINAAELAEPINGDTTLWLKEKALSNNYGIMGSIMIQDNHTYYNRLLLTYPCSSIKWYDKKHLFRMGKEHEVYSAGQKQQIFNFFGWKIMPQVCYDLRFPVWSRNTFGYDLLVYVANWPKPRREAWITLLKARAIENQCYVVGVNRIGNDANGISYSGDSLVINPKGEIILGLEPEKEMVQTAEISLNDLNDFRAQFPVHLDADDFDIRTKEA